MRNRVGLAKVIDQNQMHVDGAKGYQRESPQKVRFCFPLQIQSAKEKSIMENNPAIHEHEKQIRREGIEPLPLRQGRTIRYVVSNEQRQ